MSKRAILGQAHFQHTINSITWATAWFLGQGSAPPSACVGTWIRGEVWGLLGPPPCSSATTALSRKPWAREGDSRCWWWRWAFPAGLTVCWEQQTPAVSTTTVSSLLQINTEVFVVFLFPTNLPLQPLGGQNLVGQGVVGWWPRAGVWNLRVSLGVGMREWPSM